MYKRYWLLIGVLAVALAAYGVWWMMAAEQITNRLKAQINGAMPPGVSVTYQTGRVAGFPFRFMVELTDLTVTIGDGSRFSAVTAQAMMQPGNGDHIIFDIEGAVNYTLATGSTGTIRAERLLASIRRMPDGAFWTDVDAAAPRVDPAFGPAQSANRAGVHLRTGVGNAAGNDVGAYDISITAAALRQAGSGAPPLSIVYNGQTVEANGQPLDAQATADLFGRF